MHNHALDNNAPDYRAYMWQWSRNDCFEPWHQSCLWRSTMWCLRNDRMSWGCVAQSIPVIKLHLGYIKWLTNTIRYDTYDMMHPIQSDPIWYIRYDAGSGEVAQWFRALAALPEYRASTPITHRASYLLTLWLQFQVTWRPPLAAMGTAGIWCLQAKQTFINLKESNFFFKVQRSVFHSL